jgi:NAD(P)-dependent dehydrogenase (short-subunit alcohol dehydrogenase family)
MTDILNDKVALVTGASRGIGKSISLALAAQKATVILAARDEQKLTETASAISENGGRSHIIKLELENESSINKCVNDIENQFGKLDILVNNAGITHSALLENTKTDDFDRCIAVNARGPFIMIRQALPLLRKAKQGYIINIASVVGVKGYPMQSAYGASKHALRGMTISLAEELTDTNIRVHLLCPGGVDTELVSQVRPDIKKDDLITPDEIAELVLYLVTHKGNAVLDELHIRRAVSSPWF